MTSLNTPQRKSSRISRIPERFNPNWLHQLVDDDNDDDDNDDDDNDDDDNDDDSDDEFYSARSWSSSEEETDENLVTCDRCGNRWDGNAQCFPCFSDDESEQENDKEGISSE